MESVDADNPRMLEPLERSKFSPDPVVVLGLVGDLENLFLSILAD
jgi:hypothetical protein